MNTPFYEAIVAEQREVQSTKHQGRTIEEYETIMFPICSWDKKRTSAVADMLANHCVVQPINFEGIIEHAVSRAEELPAHWVDMGGGRGLAQRAINALGYTKEELKNTTVDLFDYGLEGLSDAELEYLEEIEPGISSDSSAPNIQLADVSYAQIEGGADLITSVEVVQYLHNPIQALANWYNQLRDGGLMIVGTQHDWSAYIRYKESDEFKPEQGETMLDFINQLEDSDITVAASFERDWENGYRPQADRREFRVFAVEKKPGTLIEVAGLSSSIPIVESKSLYKDYKVTKYTHRPPISVLEQ